MEFSRNRWMIGFVEIVYLYSRRFTRPTRSCCITWGRQTKRHYSNAWDSCSVHGTNKTIVWLTATCKALMTTSAIRIHYNGAHKSNSKMGFRVGYEMIWRSITVYMVQKMVTSPIWWYNIYIPHLWHFILY